MFLQTFQSYTYFQEVEITIPERGKKKKHKNLPYAWNNAYHFYLLLAPEHHDSIFCPWLVLKSMCLCVCNQAFLRAGVYAQKYLKIISDLLTFVNDYKVMRPFLFYMLCCVPFYLFIFKILFLFFLIPKTFYIGV